MKRHLTAFLLVFALLIGLMSGISVASAVDMSGLYGVWTGHYVGSSGGKPVNREIRLDIDSVEDHSFQGIASIDGGESGRYFFSGEYSDDGTISFEGTEWYENPKNFGFPYFSGQYIPSEGKLTGITDDDENNVFSMKKNTGTPDSMRVVPSEIPSHWVGEYDGHHNSIVVRRTLEIDLQGIGEDGSVSGVASFYPSDKADPAYGAYGTYHFDGHLNTQSGKFTMQGYDWISYRDNYDSFGFAYLDGYFDFSGTPKISGHSEDGFWEMSAAEVDKNPIVIIPGILGSRLYSETNGGQVWDPVSWDTVLKDPATSLGNKMKYGSRLYVHHIYDNQAALSESEREFGALNTYEELVNRLCSEFGASRKIYFFSYDFRQSNMDSAKDLQDFIKWLGGEVDVVCHSMGGLVLSCYVEQFGWDHIGKTITMGTPYEGAPKLINSVLNWDFLTNRKEVAKAIIDKQVLGTGKELLMTGGDCLLGLSGLTKAVKSGLPALAELAPSEAYVNRHAVYRFDHAVKKGVVQTGYYYDINYAQYRNICTTIFGNSLFSGAEKMYSSIKKQSGINILIDHDSSYFVVGINQPTIASLLFNSGTSLNSLECDDLIYEAAGDGTVPYDSATMMGTLTSSLRGTDRLVKVAATHTNLVKNKKALDFAVNALREGQFTSLDDAAKNHRYAVIRVACPVDVEILNGSELLSSFAESFCSEASFGRMDIIGANDDIKMFCVDTSANNEITLQGTDKGTLDYTIRYFDESGTLQKENTFQNVPLTANTVITTDTSDKGTVLTVDKDGDGKTDSTLTESDPPVSVQEAAPTMKFTDVKESDYFYDAVLWAVKNGITAGTSDTTFSPAASCTRAQMVTFLWRTNGSPKAASSKNPFTDVKKEAYYYDAVLWAAEKNITAGTSKTTFSPNATVTRAQTVTFLWRLADKPSPKASNPFSDVAKGQYYTDAVLWAVEKNVTAGTSKTTFSPGNPCTRAQIVTFLYRDLTQ